MLLATLGPEPDAPKLGLIHLVGKRQGTYKISPLIVEPSVRGRLRVGSRLLHHADTYARDRHARSLYCTVAEENKLALRFFVRAGFVIAGRSHSHYKADITELMLYKLLTPDDNVTMFDQPHISVLPMEVKHEAEVRALLLETLPSMFSGIDNEWIDSLFASYHASSGKGPSRKTKVVFVATGRQGDVLGVAAATPKHGRPIKILPLVARSLPVFVALITDIPFQLHAYGRKLYAHLSPSTDETLALQGRGWRLDAALPAAYRADAVTQQWSLDLDSEDFMRTIRTKQRYLDFIKAGTKPLEVRVAYNTMKSIRVGERVRFASRDDSQVVVIRDVRKYPSFSEMALVEDVGKIVPGQPPEEVISILKRIYPPEKERLGVVVLDVALSD